MLADLALLGRLRARHARTACVRAMALFGANPQDERDFLERIYQLYAVALAGAALALLWAALLSACAQAGAALGAEGAAGAVSLTTAAGLAVSAIRCMRGAFASPLRFTHADAAFVAMSSMRSRAIVLDHMGAHLAAGAMAGALAGWLLSVLAGEGALALALSGMAAGMALTCAPWVAGVTRLAVVAACAGGRGIRHERSERGGLKADGREAGRGRKTSERETERKPGGRLVKRFDVRALAVAAACASGCGALAIWALSVPAVAFVQMAASPSFLFALVGAGMAEGALCLALAPRIDMTRAVEESAFYADMQPLGTLAFTNAEAVRACRRRRRLMGREAWLSLPRAEGRGALLAHGALSLVRQPERLGPLLMQGLVLTPFGAAALLGDIPFAGASFALLIWLEVAIACPQGSRELARTFRDGMRCRALRDLLPFSNLELLALSAVVPLALTTALSWAVCGMPFTAAGMAAGTTGAAAGASMAAAAAGVGAAGTTFGSASLPVALALCAVLNIAAALVNGFDFLDAQQRVKPTAASATLVFILVTGATSLLGQPASTLSAAMALCAAAAFALHRRS